MDWIQILITIAALWGAFLSTVLATLGVLKFLKDRKPKNSTYRPTLRRHELSNY